MKIGLLVVSVIGLSVTCTTWADDLPSLGCSHEIPVKDLVAKFLSARPIHDTYGSRNTGQCGPG
jgi:hypothetical protein